jgi:hypothetical protein
MGYMFPKFMVASRRCSKVALLQFGYWKTHQFMGVAYFEGRKRLTRKGNYYQNWEASGKVRLGYAN